MNIKTQLKEIIAGKRIAILGFGAEGRSTYKLLRKYFPDLELSILDRNIDLINDSDLETDFQSNLFLGGDYLKNLNDFNLVLKSPGISLKDIDFDKDSISSQTEIFLKLFSKNTIGITGTKGKSTSSSILYHILKQNSENVFLAGNIGLPVFDIIEKINEDSIVVYELSSHQLEYCNYSPHIAVLLNLYEEHLDHYKSFEDYKLAKYNIAKHQSIEDIFICNYDDKNTEELIKKHQNPISKFSKSDIKINGEIAELSIQNQEFKVNLSKFKLRGNHNLINLLTVLNVIDSLKINIKLAIEQSYSFKGLQHRLEFVGKFKGISFYNDSIATIPEACISAIESFPKIDFLLLGGFNRGINYDNLVEYLIKKGIPNLILMDEVGEILASKLKSKAKSNLISAENIEQALSMVSKIAKEDDICLFSPAAKTPPPLKDFKERGAYYKKCIKKLFNEKS